MDITKFSVNIDGSLKREFSAGILIIDKDDINLVGVGIAIKLQKRNNGYIRVDVYKNKKRIGVLSRMIMKPKSELVVDHINHNTLDNRRVNLRIATKQQNRMNNLKRNKPCSSIYKGVSYVAKQHNGNTFDKPWRAFGKKNGIKKSLGYFKTEHEAAKAYNCYVVENFKDFASINVL